MRRIDTAETLGGIVGGSVIGACLMFVLDPERGRRRRALIEGKAMRMTHKAQRAAEKIARDVSNRIGGIRAQARHIGEHEEVSDGLLIQRVRSRLGRAVSHPRAVRVRADDGTVMLDGDVLRSELRALLSGVSSVRGVRGVKSKVRVHESAEGIPALQGGRLSPCGRRRMAEAEAGTRILAALAGGLGAALLSRGRGPGATLAGLAGAAIAAGLVAGPGSSALRGAVSACREAEVRQGEGEASPV